MTVGQSDPLFIHQLATPTEARKLVLQMLERVGLTPQLSIISATADLSGGSSSSSDRSCLDYPPQTPHLR